MESAVARRASDKSARTSMFQRRVRLLVLLLLVVLGIEFIQLARLSLFEGDELLAQAEARLVRRNYLPTYRGRLLDRNGRIIAEDRAASDIAIAYELLNGNWQRHKSRVKAKRMVGATAWSEMTASERDEAGRAYLPLYEQEAEGLLETIAGLGGIGQLEMQRQIDEIKGRVQRMASTVWARQLSDHLAKGRSEKTFRVKPIREQEQAHVVLAGLDEEKALSIEYATESHRDLIEIRPTRARFYPWSAQEVTLRRDNLPAPIRAASPMTVHSTGVADHLLGNVRSKVWREDVQRRPMSKPDGLDLGGYRQGDEVGASGLEWVLEDRLRGERGLVRTRVDRGVMEHRKSKPGGDVPLTIDIELQARVQAILDPSFGLTQVQPWHRNTGLPLGTRLNAAAIVLEVATGEILAAVSMPTIDMGLQMSDVDQDIAQPIVNRPFEAIYPPGSIIKPLVLAVACAEDQHRLHDPIECTGHFFPNRPTVARCWIYRQQHNMGTHGPLIASEALARSCNIFFYTLADRLGLTRLAEGYRQLGLGQMLMPVRGLGTVGGDGESRRLLQSSGLVPDTISQRAQGRGGELAFTTAIAGIGQGPIAWTPLQAVNAYAMLARGGDVRDPTLIAWAQGQSPQPQRMALHMDEAVQASILKGLRESVSKRYGTGHHLTHSGGQQEPIFNAPGAMVWGKTGTAQAPPRKYDSNQDGQLNHEDEAQGDLDHAWFVGLAGDETSQTPAYAIAVIVEYGGSGGRCAGPVANQIVWALQETGYLERPFSDSAVMDSALMLVPGGGLMRSAMPSGWPQHVLQGGVNEGDQPSYQEQQP